ncbi:amino acid adenylation domain-containing protein [Streptomyces sp. NPDC051001]|uniref:non-ribosomal peptide synthetase n=1 Tax=Streptomyces sp. NPDC051001 TaxID=3155795 RepID=UPI00343C06B0
MFPLSFAQQRLWFLDRLEGPSATYNVPVAVRMSGTLDLAALHLAFGDLVRRHEILRTAFRHTDGVPGQWVLAPERSGFVLQTEDVGADGLTTAIRRIADEPFVLGDVPPVRARLLRTASDEHVLVLVMHHILCDGWSLAPLLGDLAAAYNARRDGSGPDWAQLPVQYSDFTLWQRELLGASEDTGSLLNRQLDYWRQTLADLPEELALPYDRPRPATASYRGGRCAFAVSATTHAAVVALARQTRSTPFMVLQAAVALLLSRLGAGTDIPLGTLVAGRTDKDLDDLVGLFVNTQVLRADVSGAPSFRELVQRLRERSLDAYSYQDLPFDRIVEELNPVRSSSRHPLFQVAVELHSGRHAVDLRGLDTEVEVLSIPVAKFDLAFALREHLGSDGAPEGLDGALEFATDLFDPETAAMLAERYTRCLEDLVQAPDLPVTRLDITTPAERALLTAWNDTTVELPGRNVADLFEDRVARSPEAIALVAGDVRLGYAELNLRANRLAHHLLSLGVGPDVTVAVALPRTEAAVVAWLAVQKAGGSYAPIDPHYPMDRIRGILTDARPTVLLASRELADSLGPVETLPHLITDLSPAAGRRTDNPTDRDRPQPLNPDHVSYVIHTSGSTGRPKGVAVPYRALTNLWTYHTAVTFPPPEQRGERLRVALSASLAFDTSWEGVLAMLAGHELHLLDEETRRDPARMVDYVRHHGIGQMDVTPSFAQQMLAEGLLAKGTGLRTLMLGGEAVSDALWQELSRLPDTTVYNYYGPSEFCVEGTGCALNEYDRAGIGRPVQNTQVHLLDEHLNPVPPGVLGEIYLAGANLGRGYLGRPTLTAERFVANPFGAPGERMYRSGDLAWWTRDGFLVFVGRADDQVKLRGLRIELGEIHTAVMADPRVADAAVTVREDEPGDKRLVAYVVPAKGQSADTTALRTRLADVLPEYMVPSALVVLDELPLNANAKLDRRALPRPDYAGRSAGRAPESDLEKAVAQLFAEVLRVDTVAVEDNFFDLGGHSLLATRLVSKVRSTLGAELNLMDLFADPTVSGVATVLAQRGSSSSAPARPQLVRRSV